MSFNWPNNKLRWAGRAGKSVSACSANGTFVILFVCIFVACLSKALLFKSLMIKNRLLFLLFPLSLKVSTRGEQRCPPQLRHF